MAASATGGQGAADKNRGSSRAGVLTEVQQQLFMELHLHLEALLACEARLATGSSTSSSGPTLAELLAPDSRLRQLQNSLWRWHLGDCLQLRQLLARLSAGVTPVRIRAACQAWASSSCRPGDIATAAGPGSDDEDAAAVGVRRLVPLLDHRRAVLAGASLGSCLALGEAALAQVLKGPGVGLAAPLVRAELVQQSPLLLAALGVPYIEHRGLLVWECNRWAHVHAHYRRPS
jgi:hypothetical protein